MSLNIDNNDAIKHIVTPLTPYFLCKYFYSKELLHAESKGKSWQEGYDFVGYNTDSIIDQSKNIYLHNNIIDKIKENDIIQVQVNLFESFINNILPNINFKIIIFTSQYHLPQLHKNELTENLINNDKVTLWISQNPIYINHDKYMAFPYGIQHQSVSNYMKFLKKYNNQILDKNTKTNMCFNSPSSVWNHLPQNHIRRHPRFSKLDSCHKSRKLDHEVYLKSILKSKFTISTGGDRDDCYRHYECIGLNSIPISNISYKEIFDNNMITLDVNDILKVIDNEKVFDYHPPNRDIITIEYWRNKMSLRLQEKGISNQI